jgi:hypothetical protein
MKTQLEVGDKIYMLEGSRVKKIYTVLRVTATQAVCENDFRFKREIRSYPSAPQRFVSSVAKPARWSRVSYLLESEELHQQEERERLAYKLKCTDYSTLPIEALRKLSEIVKENLPKGEV